MGELSKGLVDVPCVRDAWRHLVRTLRDAGLCEEAVAMAQEGFNVLQRSCGRADPRTRQMRALLQECSVELYSDRSDETAKKRRKEDVEDDDEQDDDVLMQNDV